MAKRHKELHLRGTIPDMKDENFFNRFDSQVIQQRKEFILNLLNFISQYPSLYKMHAFQYFFELSHSISSDDSPEHQRSPIETICEELDVPIQPKLSLIDPIKDEMHNKNNETPISCSQDSSIVSEDSCSSELNLSGCAEVEEVSVATQETTQSVDQVDSSDYIYEAALKFSEAVRFEANGNFRRAFENYKRGIGILLTSSKHDVIEDRKCIAKEKTKKYLARAEQIYEQYLMNDETSVSDNVDSSNAATTNETSIERPIDQLSRFKVIKILETVMQVQDNMDKEIFIIKAIEKPSSNNLPQMICLPRNIPFMVNLVAYFQSEATIYLLLQQASGGRLWDYIRSYEPTKHTSLPNRTASLASLFNFTEPSDTKPKTETCNDSSKYVTESPFMAMLNQYRNTDYSRSNSNPSSLSEVIQNFESNADIPAFDVLSQDMDVLDLVNCSQKLIRSVSNTLDQSRSKHINSMTVSDSETTVEATVEAIVNNRTVILQSPQQDDESSRCVKSVINGTQKRIPERSIKRWGSEIVICLLSLHEKDIFCGDLNPNNLLLGVKGQLNLTYFYRQDQRQLKIDCIDTLYVAPERPLDYRSDWWSFGVIIFELLTGESFIACHPGGISSYYEIQYPDVTLSDDSKDLLNEVSCR